MEGDINALRALWRVVLDPVDLVLAMMQDARAIRPHFQLYDLGELITLLCCHPSTATGKSGRRVSSERCTVESASLCGLSSLFFVHSKSTFHLSDCHVRCWTFSSSRLPPDFKTNFEESTLNIVVKIRRPK